MKAQFNCQCEAAGALVNITEWHSEFCQRLQVVEKTPRLELHQCATCMQFWRIDVEGLRNVAYAIQLETDAHWQQYDDSGLVKAHMLKNRGGFADRVCRLDACQDHAINGSAYCLDHLYQSGARL